MINIVLEGSYSKVGNQLITEKFSLLLVKRKETTPSKSSKFILAKLPNGSRKYISSMYDTTTKGVYKLDYLGRTYSLSISFDKADITLC